MDGARIAETPQYAYYVGL